MAAATGFNVGSVVTSHESTATVSTLTRIRKLCHAAPRELGWSDDCNAQGRRKRLIDHGKALWRR